MPKNNTSTSAYRAKTILTMKPEEAFLENGMFIVENGQIKDIGSYNTLKKTYSGPTKDLGDKTIVPGLINSHTHLELSHLKGKTLLGQGFEAWVKSLMMLPIKEIDKNTLALTIDSIRQSGTLCVGDISGHSPQKVFDSLQKSELYYRLFIEFLGFNPPKSNQPKWAHNLSPNKHCQIGASGHSLYSTHPNTLQMIKTWSCKNNRPFAIHLAEHSGEVELLTTGRGSFADLLKKFLLPESYVPPGMSPIAYADQLGLLDKNTLAVHCVLVNTKDIRILSERNTYVCICPRSNAFIKVGRAPWEKMFKEDISLCLGTDSLASNIDLNLWEEAEYLLKNWETELTLYDLIKFMTVNPAQALDIQKRLGSLEPGKIAHFSILPDKISALFSS